MTLANTYKGSNGGLQSRCKRCDNKNRAERTKAERVKERQLPK